MFKLNKKNLLWLLPFVSYLWLGGTVLIAGYFYPDYSHLTRFMSELGATGSPHGFYVNYLGFIPTEIFIFLFASISYSLIPRTRLNVIGLAFITAYACALAVAAIFPCDFECNPDVASIAHEIHMLSGRLAYLFGIVAIFLMSFGSRSWSDSKVIMIVGCILGILSLMVLMNLAGSGFPGLDQRILESLIYLWLIIFGFGLSAFVSREGVASASRGTK